MPGYANLDSVVVVSLSKKLYLHSSSLPNCTLGDLVSTGEAAHRAVTLMSRASNPQEDCTGLMERGCGTQTSTTTPTPLGQLGPSSRRICLHKAQVSEWCSGIPVLIQWVAIAVFCTDAVGFAFVYIHWNYVHVL